MTTRLYTRTLNEDEVVLVVQALDFFRTAAEAFHINRGDVQERCDELMARIIGEDATVKP